MPGRHFLIGLRPTADLHPEDRRLLSTIRPAGFIVYRANFAAGAPYEEWHARFAALIADARAAIGRDRVLVCIDHEGGTVHRPPPPVTRFAFARKWADRAAIVGRAMGLELASLGINVNFAPVVDVDSNPANPVIGPRAFGATADEVIAAASPFLEAMQEQGVLGCPKHFPGHGDTTVDSHLGLPVLDVDLPELSARELRPFGAILQAGVQLVMTAHIAFPRIDASGPATLSRRLVTDVLRGQLGYQRAVVTDDIGMRAVSTIFDQPGMFARMIASGTDLLMICSHWTETDRSYALLSDFERSLEKGELSRDVVAASASRIDALLAAAPQNVPRLLDASVFTAHAASAPLQATAGAAGQTVSLEET